MYAYEAVKRIREAARVDPTVSLDDGMLRSVLEETLIQLYALLPDDALDEVTSLREVNLYTGYARYARPAEIVRIIRMEADVWNVTATGGNAAECAFLPRHAWGQTKKGKLFTGTRNEIHYTELGSFIFLSKAAVANVVSGIKIWAIIKPLAIKWYERQVTLAGTDVLTDATADWVADEWVGGRVSLHDGLNVYYRTVYKIEDNTATDVTVNANFPVGDYTYILDTTLNLPTHYEAIFFDMACARAFRSSGSLILDAKSDKHERTAERAIGLILSKGIVRHHGITAGTGPSVYIPRGIDPVD